MTFEGLGTCNNCSDLCPYLWLSLQLLIVTWSDSNQLYLICDCFMARRLDVLNKCSSSKLKRSPAKKNVRCLIALICDEYYCRWILSLVLLQL